MNLIVSILWRFHIMRKKLLSNEIALTRLKIPMLLRLTHILTINYEMNAGISSNR